MTATKSWSYFQVLSLKYPPAQTGVLSVLSVTLRSQAWSLKRSRFPFRVVSSGLRRMRQFHPHKFEVSRSQRALDSIQEVNRSLRRVEIRVRRRSTLEESALDW